jgi:hypothetical protein
VSTTYIAQIAMLNVSPIMAMYLKKAAKQVKKSNKLKRQTTLQPASTQTGGCPAWLPPLSQILSHRLFIK